MSENQTSQSIFSALPDIRRDDPRFQRLSLPDFVKPDSVPIGGAVCGRVVKIIGNFTSDPKMDDTQNLWMELGYLMPDGSIEMDKGGKEILFPITGTLGQSLLHIRGQERSIVGRKLIIVRKADGKDSNYDNKMFVFESILLTEGQPLELDDSFNAPKSLAQKRLERDSRPVRGATQPT